MLIYLVFLIFFFFFVHKDNLLIEILKHLICCNSEETIKILSEIEVWELLPEYLSPKILLHEKNFKEEDFSNLYKGVSYLLCISNVSELLI